MTAVAAFANSDGGELFIGIDEDGIPKARTWRGFTDQEAANGHIQALEPLFPLSGDFQYSFLSCDQRPGLVLKLDIQKTRDIRRAGDGTPLRPPGSTELTGHNARSTSSAGICKGIGILRDGTSRCTKSTRIQFFTHSRVHAGSHSHRRT